MFDSAGLMVEAPGLSSEHAALPSLASSCSSDDSQPVHPWPGLRVTAVQWTVVTLSRKRTRVRCLPSSPEQGKKIRPHEGALFFALLVEAAGIEPASVSDPPLALHA